jgi:ketosteroid isomerase-like protein
LTVERRTAQELLDRLHRAQNEYYAGGDSRGLSDLLAADVRWSVPGDNALAGVYIGVDHVLDYMQRRRRLAACTLRLVRRDVLVGRGQRIAAVTDGVVLRSGRVHTWGTVGLYEVADGRIRRCWLLPLDAMSTRSGPDVAADLSFVPRRAWMVRR